MLLPLTIAASNFDVVIYVLAGVVWVVFQLLSRAAKSRPPGPPDPSGSSPARPDTRPAADDLKELMEMLSGRRSEEPVMKEPATEAPVTEEPPRLRPTPPSPRARRPLVSRPSVYAANTAVRPVTAQTFKQRPTRGPRPPPPLRRPVPGAGRREVEDVPARPEPIPPVAAVPVLESSLRQQAANMQAQLHVAPLMHMRWPKSAFGQMIGSLSRPSRQSPLRQRLQGRQAFRQAMVSRLVLGPPGGR